MHIYNIARALVLSNSYWAIMVKIFMYARPCSIKWRVQFQFSCKVSVEFSFLLFKFRQCEDYSQQSKLYFGPLTFVKLRCLLKREYFDFVCLNFHRVFLTLLAYIFIIIINSKKRIFHWQFYKPGYSFSFNCCSTGCGVLGSSLILMTFVFLHRALWKLIVVNHK